MLLTLSQTKNQYSKLVNEVAAILSTINYEMKKELKNDGLITLPKNHIIDTADGLMQLTVLKLDSETIQLLITFRTAIVLNQTFHRNGEFDFYRFMLGTHYYNEKGTREFFEEVKSDLETLKPNLQKAFR